MPLNQNVGIGILVEDRGKFSDILLCYGLKACLVDFKYYAGIKCNFDSFSYTFDSCSGDILLDFLGLFVHLVPNEGTRGSTDDRSQYCPCRCIPGMFANQAADNCTCAGANRCALYGLA